MKHLKHLGILTIIIFSATFTNAQPTTSKKVEALVWYTDIMQANEISKTSGKPLFAFFTGSDWCGWCRKLQNDVFSKLEFIQWAAKNVVLVELDFPKGKALSPELTQQNASLQQTFGVQGYPTIWLFFLNKNPEGTGFSIDPLGSLGYPSGAQVGKEQVKFIEGANALLKKKSTKK